MSGEWKGSEEAVELVKVESEVGIERDGVIGEAVSVVYIHRGQKLLRALVGRATL